MSANFSASGYFTNDTLATSGSVALSCAPGLHFLLNGSHTPTATLNCQRPVQAWPIYTASSTSSFYYASASVNETWHPDGCHWDCLVNLSELFTGEAPSNVTITGPGTYDNVTKNLYLGQNSSAVLTCLPGTVVVTATGNTARIALLCDANALTLQGVANTTSVVGPVSYTHLSGSNIVATTTSGSNTVATTTSVSNTVATTTSGSNTVATTTSRSTTVATTTSGSNTVATTTSGSSTTVATTTSVQPSAEGPPTTLTTTSGPSAVGSSTPSSTPTTSPTSYSETTTSSDLCNAQTAVVSADVLNSTSSLYTRVNTTVSNDTQTLLTYLAFMSARQLTDAVSCDQMDSSDITAASNYLQAALSQLNAHILSSINQTLNATSSELVELVAMVQYQLSDLRQAIVAAEQNWTAAAAQDLDATIDAQARLLDQLQIRGELRCRKRSRIMTVTGYCT
ncbi:mucin-5B [Hyalella azteca]|uniref:Mucin-5B n=1 Tax=Hyalella azteca TaxID=294128 RepID=A0A8B7NIW5_HYAAZ|nr:mucin-5B [Hyalella azteca]